MITEKQYEILNSLPSYGPMYVPITHTEEPFYSEGFVVRFYKSDKSEWVANFQLGWTNFSKVFDFPKHKTVIIVAGGQGYVMSPDNEAPKFTFGLTISEALQTDNGSLVFADNINIIFFDNSNGQFWHSNRISWDGIKDLKLADNILYGKSYDPTNSIQEWSDFSINLKTKEITGGTWREFLKNNPHLEVEESGMLKEKTQNKKAWWKIW